MNDIEQRITDALRAEAARVTEDSLRLPDILERRPRRWPALAVAGAVAAAAVGIVVVTAVTAGRDRAEPVGPAPTTSRPPATSTTTTQTPVSTTAPTTRPPSSAAEAPPRCGDKPCPVVQSVRVGRETLEVLAAESTTYPGNLADWKVRVRGGAVLPGAPASDSFVRKDSLRCATVAGRPICLLYTSFLGDSDTSLGIAKDSSGWRFTGATFPTPYGALRVDPRDLDSDGTPEVVSVESRFLSEDGGPERELWTVGVWRWDGTRLGCVPRVATKEELPGWPSVAPDLSTVDAQYCF